MLFPRALISLNRRTSFLKHLFLALDHTYSDFVLISVVGSKTAGWRCLAVAHMETASSPLMVTEGGSCPPSQCVSCTALTAVSIGLVCSWAAPGVAGAVGGQGCAALGTAGLVTAFWYGLVWAGVPMGVGEMGLTLFWSCYLVSLLRQ